MISKFVLNFALFLQICVQLMRDERLHFMETCVDDEMMSCAALMANSRVLQWTSGDAKFTELGKLFQ